MSGQPPAERLAGGYDLANLLLVDFDDRIRRIERNSQFIANADASVMAVRSLTMLPEAASLSLNMWGLVLEEDQWYRVQATTSGSGSTEEWVPVTDSPYD